MMSMIINSARELLETRKTRSAWDKGVNAYALDLLDDLEEYAETVDDLKDPRAIEVTLLNGARNWSEYSWGGSALIYDGEIAEALCTPSELVKTRHGARRPNVREEWPDVQARALFQAAQRVIDAVQDSVKALGAEALAA